MGQDTHSTGRFRSSMSSRVGQVRPVGLVEGPCPLLRRFTREFRRVSRAERRPNEPGSFVPVPVFVK